MNLGLLQKTLAVVDEEMADVLPDVTDQMEHWLRQNGIVNESLVKKMIKILLVTISDIRGVNIFVDRERNELELFLGLKWFKYYTVNKNRLADIVGRFVGEYFPTFNLTCHIYKYDRKWEQIVESAYAESRRQRDRESKSRFVDKFISKPPTSGNKK